MKEKAIKDAMGSIENRIRHVYNQGYEQGRNERYIGYGDAYTKGLNDAWEAAKKIHDGQISYEVFGLDKTGNGFSYASPLNWGETITAQEAIIKIKEYEDTQKSSEDMPCITPEEMQKCKDIVKKYTPKQEPCDDAISRDAVIEATHHCGDLQEVRGVVQQLPSVTQKSGEWIKIQSGDKDFPESIVCSKCDRENSHLDFNENAEPIGKVFVTSKFCPNCGCRMLFNRSTENHELNKNLDKEEGEKHE